MKRLMLTTVLVMAAGGAFSAGTHSGGHGHDEAEEAHGHGHGHGEMMRVGKPGDPGDVDRTIEIIMKETDDGQMLFAPDRLVFSRGETVRLAITNVGELEHEFVLDTRANNEEHRALMAKFPEMEHDDPNAIRLAPGEKGDIVWTFANTGEFQFACLIPGHMESGMHGPVQVTEN